MDAKEKCLAWLDGLDISYRLVEHPAAYTMEDIIRYGVDKEGQICKNLFLRDSKKGKRHFLVVVHGDKAVDLKALGEALGQRLSFASAGRLEQYLQLKQGEVTPLALMNDEDHVVEVLLDRDLAGRGALGFHPCVNTASVILGYDDLRKILEAAGNPVAEITI